MTTYRQPADVAQPPATITTSAPLRSSRVESEIMVPFLQTAITAVIVGVALALLTWRFDWSWDVPIFGVVVVLVGMWVWRLLRSDALMWKLERMTGLELDGKPGIGKPTLTVVNGLDARAKAAQDDYNTVRASVTAQQSLIAFVYLCASVPKPTEKALGIPTGDRDGYVAYRNKLIQLGIGAWDDPNRHDLGWHLCVSTNTAARIIEQHIL